MNFLWRSKNQYGVHSPFVYDYLTKGLRLKPDPEDWKRWKAFKTGLLTNHSSIKVTDFGAGSRVFRGPERKVSQIAKIAGISDHRAEILFKTVNYFKPKTILEIGTSLGMSTAIMALAAPDAVIHTLEGCPKTSKVAENQFEFNQLNNIHLHLGEFSTTLPKLTRENTFDLVYIDGNHQKNATLDYFDFCLQAAKEQSLFIFDDIHWNEGMEEAWEVIKNHKKVSLSIESYTWGMLFFNTGREKEHFSIRM